MHKLIAVVLAAAALLACTPYNEANRQNTLNESTTTNGPSVHGQSRAEAEREGR